MDVMFKWIFKRKFILFVLGLLEDFWGSLKILYFWVGVVLYYVCWLVGGVWWCR